MLLKEMYDYIAEQRAVTVQQLQRRFGLNLQHIEHIINTWAARGKVKPLYDTAPCETKNSAVNLCGTCRIGCAAVVLTLWCLADE